MHIEVVRSLKRWMTVKKGLIYVYIWSMTYWAFYSDIATSKTGQTSTRNRSVQEEMSARLIVMKSACSAHGLDKPGNESVLKPYPWEYLINEEHHLVWCNIFKSGSTSWLNIFNILRPNQRPRSRSLTPVAQARENYMRPTVEQLLDAMNKSVTFIVGRNPLERLVSGYRDKILNAISGTDHDRLRRVSCVMATAVLQYWSQFVINEDLNDRTMDMHWEPDYILQKADIKGIVSLHRDNVGKGGQTSELLTQRYLRELPPKLYAQLLKIYQVDLDMFGYEAPKFDYNSPSVLSSLMMY